MSEATARTDLPVVHQVTIPPEVPMVHLLGRGDETLRAMEAELPGVAVHARGNLITLRGAGPRVEAGERLIDEAIALVRAGIELTPDAVRRVAAMLEAPAGPGGPGSAGAEAMAPRNVLTQSILSSRGRTIRPKTLGQQRYVQAIEKSTITFGIGPAGTGKTYLAMAKAVQALQAKKVNRIVLTRPAVEAGERLGFLPGTLFDKIDPYLRPLYDALHDMIDPESIPKLMEAGTIEVAPLAYMRGRTLNDAFIVLDEAQNTSSEQMKMFLTRLGFGSRIVVTGDVTQTDLPGGTASGLRAVRDILVDIDDVSFCELSSADVVRHRLVSQIIDAYERYRPPAGPRAVRSGGQ